MMNHFLDEVSGLDSEENPNRGPVPRKLTLGTVFFVYFKSAISITQNENCTPVPSQVV